MRTPGIPLWLTLILGVTVIIGTTTGIAALAGSGVMDHMNAAWGGRSIGSALAAAIAIGFRNPVAYFAAFISGTAREVGDLIHYIQTPEIGLLVTSIVVCLLFVWLVGAYYAFRAIKTQ